MVLPRCNSFTQTKTKTIKNSLLEFLAMASNILPLHQRRNMNPTHSGPTKQILRLTEKYVLAISLVAFSLVFFGAFYLPQDQLLKRTIRGRMDDIQQFQPHVNDPHQHVGGDHRDAERDIFNKKAQNDADLQSLVNEMQDQLSNNEKKIDRLNSRLESLKKIQVHRLKVSKDDKKEAESDGKPVKEADDIGKEPEVDENKGN